MSTHAEAYAAVECGKCHKKNVRLYRPYGNFYRTKDNVCNKHVPDDQRGWYVPLCLDTDGSVWGYTSVREESGAYFFSLPEASDKHLTYLQTALLIEGEYQHWSKEDLNQYVVQNGVKLYLTDDIQ